MRRLLLVCAFLAVGPLVQPGSAHALGIGPTQLPDFDLPVSVNDQPGTRIKPSWLPANMGENATVVLVPGTTDYDGADQLERSRDIGFYDSADPDDPAYYDPTFIIIGADEGYDNYPAAFGFTLLGVPINLAGKGTFNESVDIGTEDAVKAATDAYRADPDQMIIVNGYSQSGPVAMNAAYVIHRDNLIPDDNMTVVVGADSRFPNTGVENVVPSFIPGMYTNGDRDPADTGDIQVISYCVRGDATCGVGNPFAHPVSTIFYLLPGFYVHAFLNGDINDYDETAEWTVGNTTYVVLDGGNPWGMMLRDLGLDVPTEFDTALSTLVPVPMPGQQATIAGQPVPTPRELQERIYQRHGWEVPVTDPDVVDKQDVQSTAQSSADVPNRIASPTATKNQRSTDPAADEPQYPDQDERGPQSTTTADENAETSDDTDTAAASDGESARDSDTTTSETATTNDTTSSLPKHREQTMVSQRVESTRRVSLGHRPQAPTVRRDVRVSEAVSHPSMNLCACPLSGLFESKSVQGVSATTRRALSGWPRASTTARDITAHP